MKWLGGAAAIAVVPVAAKAESTTETINKLNELAKESIRPAMTQLASHMEDSMIKLWREEINAEFNETSIMAKLKASQARRGK
jgi:chemotaxis protein CheY-P-specific phosphatase CheC